MNEQKLNFLSKITKFFLKLITILISILIIAFVIYGIKLGIFQDKTILIHTIKKFGFLAPIFFIFLQIIQVVFPVIPGGASCLAGVLAFGPLYGFFYNYIGLAIGSCCAYFLSKHLGKPLVEKLFSKEVIDHYFKYIQNNKFTIVFLLGIFLPGLPDDLLCYIAGLSKMRFRTFLLIIVAGKPWTLILYSLFVKYL